MPAFGSVHFGVIAFPIERAESLTQLPAGLHRFRRVVVCRSRHPLAVGGGEGAARVHPSLELADAGEHSAVDEPGSHHPVFAEVEELAP